MSERPIIFSAPMVRAILAGRKTQARRVVARAYDKYEEPKQRWAVNVHPDGSGLGWIAWWIARATAEETAYLYPGPIQKGFSPPYRPGDRLWVPSIHRPRWASRITLEVNAVRVERLQDISEEDAIAEGVEPVPIGGFRDYDIPCDVLHSVPPEYSFKTLWNHTNAKKPGRAWDDNPWVWVIEFGRVQP